MKKAKTLTVAHAVARGPGSRMLQPSANGVRRPTVIYRSYRPRSIGAALTRARTIHDAGYLVWIEATGQAATR